MKSAGKVWGTTTQIEANGSLEFHRIEFKANYQCSEHYHSTKSNGFFVEQGKMLIKTWPENTDIVDMTLLSAGDYMEVPAGVWHQFVGVTDGIAFELYWSEFDKDDIVRRSQGSRVSNVDHEESKGEQQDLNWDGN
jgi:mannose-6-phosphate isomerase-like protein (cupin superfamily)